MEKLREQFGDDVPFNIELSDNIKNIEDIDKPFTDEATIFICDDRIAKDNYYYKNTDELELNELCDYLIITRKNIDKPITIRQIVNLIIKSKHYNNDIVSSDDHQNLTGFYKKSPNSIQYYASFEN
jgi:hypothetical protein